MGIRSQAIESGVVARESRLTLSRMSLFDIIVWVSLLLYVLLILALLLSNVSYLDLSEYSKIFSSPDLKFAMRLSLLTSSLSTALALLFALPVAYALSRYDFPGRLAFDTIVDIPIVLPALVTGVSILVFFQTPVGRAIQDMGFQFIFTPAGIVLSQFIIISPYAVRTIKSALDSMDKRLEDVSRTLGWSKWQVFYKVTLPMVKNGIIAGGIISWSHAMGLYGPMMVVAGTTRQKTEVLATSIYLELSVGEIGLALAISMLMVVFATTALVVFKRLAGSRYSLW